MIPALGGSDFHACGGLGICATRYPLNNWAQCAVIEVAAAFAVGSHTAVTASEAAAGTMLTTRTASLDLSIPLRISSTVCTAILATRSVLMFLHTHSSGLSSGEQGGKKYGSSRPVTPPF